MTAQVRADQQLCQAGFVYTNLAESGVIIQVGRWSVAFRNQCISCFSKGEPGEERGLRVVYLPCPMGKAWS